MDNTTVAPLVAIIAGTCLGITAVDAWLLVRKTVKNVLVKRTQR